MRRSSGRSGMRAVAIDLVSGRSGMRAVAIDARVAPRSCAGVANARIYADLTHASIRSPACRLGARGIGGVGSTDAGIPAPRSLNRCLSAPNRLRRSAPRRSREPLPAFRGSGSGSDYDSRPEPLAGPRATSSTRPRARPAGVPAPSGPSLLMEVAELRDGDVFATRHSPLGGRPAWDAFAPLYPYTGSLVQTLPSHPRVPVRPSAVTQATVSPRVTRSNPARVDLPAIRGWRPARGVCPSGFA